MPKMPYAEQRGETISERRAVYTTSDLSLNCKTDENKYEVKLSVKAFAELLVAVVPFRH